MKNLLIVFAIGLFLFLNQNLANAKDLTTKQKAAIEKEVDTEFQKMVKAAEKLDYNMLALGVDDHLQAGFITNNTYYAQFDTLIKAFEAQAQGVLSQSISFQNKKITVLSDRIVLITANGQSIGTVDSGSTFTVNFFWTFVYEKIDGQWKVIQSHQSTGK